MYPIYHLAATLLVFLFFFTMLNLEPLSWQTAILFAGCIVAGFLIDLDHTGSLYEMMVCGVKMPEGGCPSMHRGRIHQGLFAWFLVAWGVSYAVHRFMDGWWPH